MFCFVGLPDLSVYNTVVMETYREFKEYVPFVEVFTVSANVSILIIKC